METPLLEEVVRIQHFLWDQLKYLIFVTIFNQNTHKSHQPTVDRDSLAGSVSCGSRTFQPLRASQVHKVELRHQRFKLWLGNGACVHAVQLLILCPSILLIG